MSNDASDRRRAPRTEAFVAAEIVAADGRRHLAVVQDASSVGLQLLTKSRLSKGDRFRVEVQIDDATRIAVQGEAARVMPLEADGLWRFRVGVAVDAPSEELAQHAEAIQARQRALERGRGA